MNLDLYNNYISRYRGKGYLILKDGYHADCTFDACQFTNGKIQILCKFISIDAGLMVYRKSAIRFEGVTTEGSFIYGSGNMLYIKGEMGTENSATYSISKLYITKNRNRMANKIAFGLTNLELDGQKHKLQVGSNQNELSKCVTIELVPIKNYIKIINQLEALNGVNVTYQAIIGINNKEDSEIFEGIVDDLCYLLSVAQGTKIQWIYVNRILDEDCILSCLHSNRRTKRYNPSTLIHSHDIEKFIKCTYNSYKEKKIALKLDKGLIDAYLDAQSQEDYIETRAVKLAVTIEMLKATLIELPEFGLEEHVLDNNYFKNQIAPELCDKFKEILTNKPPNNKSRKGDQTELDCLNQISCINRISFRRILKKICKSICPKLNKDINRFVVSRNSLIHNARFHCQMVNPKCDNSEKIEEYFFLINFINILFLRLLGYTGNYYDYRDFHNIQIKKL